MLRNLLSPLHPVTWTTARSTCRAWPCAHWAAWARPRCAVTSQGKWRSSSRHQTPTWGKRYIPQVLQSSPCLPAWAVLDTHRLGSAGLGLHTYCKPLAMRHFSEVNNAFFSCHILCDVVNFFFFPSSLKHCGWDGVECCEIFPEHKAWSFQENFPFCPEAHLIKLLDPWVCFVGPLVFVLEMNDVIKDAQHREFVF